MINLKKLEETLKIALDEDVYAGHIDKENLSSDVFVALKAIADEDPDGMLIKAKPFQLYIEQLKEQTPENEENELLAKIIEEIGPSNYENLLMDDLNYMVVHFVNDAKENDVKEDPDQVEDEYAVLREEMNEIAMERYLSVDPNPDDETHNAVLTLCQTNGEDIDAFAFTLDYDSIEGDKNQYIRNLAKDCFQEPITDDIRVEWF